MRIKLWGVRGSLPAPPAPQALRQKVEGLILQFEKLRKTQPELTARAFIEALPPHATGGYGGNTISAEVTSNSQRLIIDCGSGLRAFSDHVMQTEPQTTEFHIYLTHFHWDHLIGLPFFSPIYRKGNRVHFYSVDDKIKECLETMFRKPTFPVPYAVVAPQIEIHKLEPRKPFQIGDLSCTPYKLDHPDPCWGLRVENSGKSLAWAVDTECTRLSPEDLGEDRALYTNADLLVFDAQYTFTQAIEKASWGHASGPIGLDLALRENIKQACFIHHDPSASDAIVRAAEEQTQAYYEELTRILAASTGKKSELKWKFGFEGDEFEL